MNIKDVNTFDELNLRKTLRAHILYEQILGHPFNENDGLNGIVVLFYSFIVGSNRNSNIDYNDFLDWLDEHESMLNDFTEWMVKQNKAVKSIDPEPTGEAQETRD